MKLKEIGISFIRTSLVPPTVGFAVAWLTKHGVIAIKSEWVFVLVTFVYSAIWYGVLRAIEVLSENPKVMKVVGIFLGWPRSVSDPQVRVPVEVKDETINSSDSGSNPGST